MEVVIRVDSGLVGVYLKSVSKEDDSSSGGRMMKEGRRSRKAGGQGKETSDVGRISSHLEQSVSSTGVQGRC